MDGVPATVPVTQSGSNIQLERHFVKRLDKLLSISYINNMIIQCGQIWIYNMVGPNISNTNIRWSNISNKFYSIISVDTDNLECNYGPNDGAWVKSKQYNIDKLTEIVNARLHHGYLLTDEYELNIEKYQEAKIKMKKLNEIMLFNGPDQKIMWHNLLKNGKLSVADMIIANQYWTRRKVSIGA